MKDGFVHKHYSITIFFDIVKAYDTAWRYGILVDLKSFGIYGNMLTILATYLSNRTFRVTVGSALSRVHVQENGVPQGRVLNCTLFIVKMNSLGKALPRTVSYSMYVDDVQICFKSPSLSIWHAKFTLPLINWLAVQNKMNLNSMLHEVPASYFQRARNPRRSLH